MSSIGRSTFGTDIVLAPPHPPETVDAARRFVASKAEDAEDCARLLDMLGIGVEG